MRPQILYRGSAEKHLAFVVRGKIGPIALRAFCVLDGISVLSLVLAEKNQGNVVQQRHFRREIFLSKDERLEWMKKTLHGQASQQTMNAAVGREQHVVKTCMNPCLMIFPT